MSEAIPPPVYVNLKKVANMNNTHKKKPNQNVSPERNPNVKDTVQK